MKKALLILTLLSSLATLNAQGEERDLAWMCRLSFDAQARGIQIFIGLFEIKGQGDIHCTSVSGENVTLPVKLEMASFPISPRIGLGYFGLHGETAIISLFSAQPDDLLGTYLVGQLGGAIGVGGGILTGVHTDLPSLTLSVAIELTYGLGFAVGVESMTLSLDTQRL